MISSFDFFLTYLFILSLISHSFIQPKIFSLHSILFSIFVLFLFLFFYTADCCNIFEKMGGSERKILGKICAYLRLEYEECS